jgi:signal transduction histidine kinase/phage shock protein PspC (stress-responsive transcriptional regulator)
VSGGGAPRLKRDPIRGILGGVCAGIARRYGVDPILPRVGAVVLTIGTGGIALIFYLLAWGLMSGSTAAETTRRERPPERRGSWRIATGTALLALSVLLVFRQLGVWWSDALVWPLVLASFGVALLWGLTRTGAETLDPEDERPRDAAPGAITPPPPREQARRLSRAGFGIALVLAAALLALWANGVLDAAGDTLLAALVVAIAVALVFAPLWLGFVRRLAAERAARIRSQERAEVAAHLHDSVLQTLTLVQKQADDPAAVAKLARRQERELRDWLSGTAPARPGERLADALRGIATEVEEHHGTPIDAVVVGDAAIDERYEALAAATREALTNAAKFAGGAGPVRLYAEISDQGARVFVDDRGPGFDPDDIPEDRRGVRESIIGRMQRFGGHAALSSEPGSGTEVELTMGEPS